MNQGLTASGVSAGHVGITVVKDVHLDVGPGEVLAVLGPNGAGKTTLLLALAGLLPRTGSVTIAGEKVPPGRVEAAVKRGLGLVPDNRGVFAGLTVGEHLMLASHDHPDSREEVLDLFPALRDLADRRAGLLSGGEAQMLGLACALMRRPKVLMIDEMSIGLAPIIAASLFPLIRKYADDHGAAVVIVEQHIDLALRVADRAVVLNQGRVVLEAAGSELRGDRSKVESAYFGEGVTPVEQVSGGEGVR